MHNAEHTFLAAPNAIFQPCCCTKRAVQKLCSYFRIYHN